MLTTIKDRLAQPSTYRGIILALTAAGVGSVVTDAVAQLAMIVPGAIGLWDIVRNGRKFGQAGLNG